ncbi:DUF3788 domain-containing protein [Oscillibacter sp. MSJ-2]|uniref:DUF3788 domain-containing protein n=1 Tax=Dysosmobacter acutus TaxID=2841504 RepID=A0ABS6FCP7_9FIRM|nr:DUF3788 domain-containing protein [Dysosmobacter acutus]MBU5627830.1 DUF3788 domain-containing protein [Dysosmobacter acutus]
MDWNTLYPKNTHPTLPELSAYVDSPLWEQLLGHLKTAYGVVPRLEHSVCSGAPGWNLKYKKGGRALCTLYPAQGRYTCLVSIGGRESVEAEALLCACTDYVRTLYEKTRLFQGGRWLMIDVTTPEILEDVKALIALRMKKR